MEEQRLKERENLKISSREKSYRQLKNSVKVETVSCKEITYRIENPGFLTLEEFFRGVKLKLPSFQNRDVKFVLETNNHNFESISPYESLPSFFRERIVEKEKEEDWKFEFILGLQVILS